MKSSMWCEPMWPRWWNGTQSCRTWIRGRRHSNRRRSLFRRPQRNSKRSRIQKCILCATLPWECANLFLGIGGRTWRWRSSLAGWSWLSSSSLWSLFLLSEAEVQVGHSGNRGLGSPRGSVTVPMTTILFRSRTNCPTDDHDNHISIHWRHLGINIFYTFWAF